MKTYLTIILSLLFLSGCLEDDNNTPETTIDYESFNYVMSWIEIGTKTGGADWENISDGQKLTFFSDSVDERLGMPNNGVVVYESGIDINIKNNTSFNRTDSTLVFYYYQNKPEADTVTLMYKLYDSSILVISDTTVTPSIEIKYKRE
jgi:hypothetical protein